MLSYLQYTPVASFIFFITILTSLYTLYYDQSVLRKLMLHPYSIARKQNQFSILTSGLIHANFNHLLFNMISYYFFAFQLEMTIGHWQFGLLYIASIVLSDVNSLVKYKDSPSYYSLGASGAISAVLFSYILFHPFNKLYFLIIPFGIPAWLFAILYLCYCYYASRNKYDNINHDAHLYGALSGIVITLLLYPQLLRYLPFLQ